MRNVFFLLLMFSFPVFVIAQEMGIEKRDGREYKVYKIQKGNTLYGIHKEFDVSIEELVEANPGIDEEFKIGEKIYIPFSTIRHSKEEQDTSQYIIHTVERKETLFGISRLYGIEVNDIIALNPEAEQGLDIKQKLKIPITKEQEKEEKEATPLSDESATDESSPKEKMETEVKNLPPLPQDSVIEYTVKKKETLYSISKRFMVSVEKLVEINNIKNNQISQGQILIIPLKQERNGEEIEIQDVDSIRAIEEVYLNKGRARIEKKGKYKVLIAIPLNIHSNTDILNERITENTELNKLTEISVQFYMGVQMALDSLEKMGLNAEVEFFDTQADVNVLKGHLSKRTDIDMMIGPFYPKLMKYAADWGKNNEIPVVAVTHISTEYLNNNSYLYSSVPSPLTLISGLGKYLATEKNDANIILIYGENDATNSRINYFENSFRKNLPAGAKNSIIKTEIGSSTGRSLAHHLADEKENYVVCLSDNVQHVMRLVNALNAAKSTSNRAKKANLSMIGLKEWNNMSTLNNYYKNKLHFLYASNNHLDYDADENIDFTEQFRERYRSDPSKYAFHGFDIALSQISDLILGLNRNGGLINQFEMEQIGVRHGFENKSVFILQQENFEIHLLKVIH